MLVSCVNDITEPDKDVSYVRSRVSLQDTMYEDTKSVFVGDDSHIGSITLFAFAKDGSLLTYDSAAGSDLAGKPVECFSETGDKIEWVLPSSGEPFDIYAVANLGDLTGQFASVDNLLKSASMVWQSKNLADCSESGIPMRGIVEDVLGGSEIILPMKRVVARYDLTLKPEGLETMKILQFDICNIKSTVNVFGENEYATSGTLINITEKATQEDLKTLNEGGTVSFYVSENMQTTAGRYDLTGLNDKWLETNNAFVKPYGKSGIDSECTYVDFIYCLKDDEGTKGHYYLFLGDARTNFDVERGKKTNLSVSLREIIDPGTGDEEFSFALYDGYHTNGDLYQATNVRLRVTVPDKYITTVKNYGLKVVATNSSGEESIVFDSFNTTSFKGMYEGYGACLKEGSVNLKFLSGNGIQLHAVNNVATIKRPKLVLNGVSNSRVTVEKDYAGRESYTYYPIPNMTSLSATINGGQNSAYLYLTDEDDITLSAGYGINEEVFSELDFSIEAESRTSIFTGPLTLSNVNIEKSEDVFSDRTAHVAKLEFSIDNDGADPDRNRILTAILGSSDNGVTNTMESTLGLSVQHDFRVLLGNVDISLVVPPSSLTSATDYSGEYALKISNPSLLPFTIDALRYYDVGLLESSYTNELPGVLSNKLRTGRLINEITSWNESNNYGGLFVQDLGDILFSLEPGESTQFVKDGSDYYFPLKDGNISVWDFANLGTAALTYRWKDRMNEMQYGSFMHLIDVEMKYEESANNIDWSLYNIKAFPQNDKYRELNDAGLVFMHDGQRFTVETGNSTTDYMQMYGSMMKESALEIMDQGAVEVEFYFDNENNLMAVASEPVTVQVGVDGYIYSHIRCLNSTDPFNIVLCDYYKNSYGFTNFGLGSSNIFTLSTTPTKVDNGAIVNAFQGIRDIEYWSLLDGFKHYREHLKPYKFELSLDISGDRPISVTKVPETISYDYKKSPPVNWYINFDGKLLTTRSVQPSASEYLHGEHGSCGGWKPYVEEVVNMKVESMPKKNYGIDGSTSETPQELIGTWKHPVFYINALN